MCKDSTAGQLNGRKLYIIGARKEAGLGAIVIRVLYHCAYAIKKGYVPVVDLKHYQNQLFKEKRMYKDNAWEYYFKQPCDCSLDDIKDEDEVVIGDNKLCPDTKFSWESPLHFPKKIMDDNKTSKIKNELKKYLQFNDEVKSVVEKNKEKILENGEEVLGILLRGTDYVQRQSKDEFIQPPTKQVIKDAKQLLDSGKYKKIYLATEDASIYKEFKNEFGDLLIENNQYMYSDNYDKTKYLSEIKVDRKDHAYFLALEYLSSLYILSKCGGFIGGCTCGTRVAYILSDNWRDCVVYDYGRYGRYNSIGERLFSIKKIVTNTTNHRALTILGIKIKLKNKKGSK